MAGEQETLTFKRTVVHEWIFNFWTRKPDCSKIFEHQSRVSRVDDITQA